MDATRQLALVATVDTVQSAQRFVTAYARQDLDVSLKVEYIETNVFSQDDYIISKPANTTVSGASYRITVWALNGEAYSAEPFTHTAVLRDDMGECTLFSSHSILLYCETTNLLIPTCKDRKARLSRLEEIKFQTIK